VGARPAELLETDVLPGDRLDDVRAGDEHLRGLVDHDREVGDRRGVDRAPRAGTHDQRDLRDDAGGEHVAPEDLPVQAEGDDALLDARSTGVVDPDDRAADLHRQVHHLDDLRAEHLAERAAEDGEVLGEQAHRPPVDGRVAGDDSVAVGAVGGHVEVRGPVPGELVELHERPRIDEQVDALPGGALASGVLALDGPCGPGVHRLADPPAEVGELARRRVDVDVGGDVGAARGLQRVGGGAGRGGGIQLGRGVGWSRGGHRISHGHDSLRTAQRAAVA
jgi:hypothetical protein